LNLLACARRCLTQPAALCLDLPQALLQVLGAGPLLADLSLQGRAKLQGLVTRRLDFLLVLCDPCGHAREFRLFAFMPVFQDLVFLFELADAGLQRTTFGLQTARELHDLLNPLGQRV
jgi:hypothetical protein